MEVVQSGSAGGGGSGPAPFLLKTYDMIDDESTDEIVSWSSGNNSFVVWDPLEFARRLLPLYFKHNNFSSFIRQLNTYGFRKIDPERWEFANEDFAKDKKHMLKHIHRRKPIHSHSPSNGSFGDVERAALEEEIERLSKEKSTLQTTLWKFKQQQSGMKLHLEDLEGRVLEMEQRQQRMISFLGTAVHKPSFVEHLIRMAEISMGFSALHKKRRLPGVDYCQDVVENSSVDNHNSTSKPEFGHLLFRDFSNMLTLDISPTVSDCNLVSASLQSSNEDEGGPLRKSSGALKDVQTRREGLLSFPPETLELSDTGGSFPSKESRQVRANEDGDCHIPFHLSLTLASCPLQGGISNYSAKIPQSLGQETTTTSKFGSSFNSKEADPRVMKFSDENAITSSLEEAPTNNEVPVAAQGRVNDVFWEHFLTEKPGSLETEEACSNFRQSPFDEKKEERKSVNGKSLRNQIDMQQLTL